MLFKLSTAFVLLAALAQVKAAPALISRHEGHDDSATTGAGTSNSDLVKKNALEAQGHNARFATIKETDPCNNSEMACIDGGFAMCVSGKWSVQKCSTGTRCYSLPLLLKGGTSLVCDTEDDANLRFTSAGVTGGAKGTDSAGGDDGEDIPDCEEEGDEETSTASPTASIAARGESRFFDRRQASTIVAEFPSTSAGTLSSVSSSPTLTASSTSTSTSAAPVVTPTVVIGSNGIVTVTIVSTATVTVSATDCAATGTSSTIPVATVTSSSSATPITVTSATPTGVSSSTRSTLSTSSSVSSTTAAAQTASSSAAVILLTTSTPTGTSSPSSATGLSFSVTPSQSV